MAWPGNLPMGPWCYVDLTTCHNQPFVDSSGGSYDACAATNDTTTYDTGAAMCLLGCLPVLACWQMLYFN